MKAIFLFFLQFLIGTGLTYSQTFTFEETVDFNHGVEDGDGVLAVADGYVFCGWGYSTESGRPGVKLVKTDFAGNVIWKKEYAKQYFGYSAGVLGSIVQINDSGFAAGGAIYDSVTNLCYTALWRFNKNGDTLWVNKYSPSPYEREFQNCKLTENGGFILSGYVYLDTMPTSAIYLVKTDSLGNLLWEKQYLGLGTGGSNIVDVALDGGYIIGSWSMSPGALQQNGYLIKTDSIGNILWTKTYKGPCGSYASTVHDGGYLVWGCLDTAIHSGDYPNVAYIHRLDSAGNNLWTRYFTNDSNYLIDLYMVRELDNHNIIIAGDKETYYTSSGGWIAELDSNGDTLWQKIHYHITDSGMELGPNSIYDLRRTSDGGFICTGSAINDIGTDSFYESNADIWLLKLDSLGNLRNDTTGIPVVGENASVSVYPNPFVSDIAISIQKENLQQAAFTLTDMLGRRIFYKEETGLSNNYTKMLDLGYLPGGLYLLEVVVDGECIEKKIMKE